ncbi:2'-deoxycytidine 5'-triphosphate deaminase, partial [Pseudoalteromonas sp. SIMBA_148]
SRLSQIRFRTGKALLDESALAELHARETLVASEDPNITGGGIALSVDLSGGSIGLIGYRAKHHTALIDVDKRDQHDIAD